MDSNRRNHYRILHVQPEAPEAVIRASYRTIMQRLKAHPDLGGDPALAALLNEAYAVLTDPARRKEYDARISQRQRPRRGASGPGPDATARPAPPPAEPRRPASRAPATPGGRRLPRVARPQAARLYLGPPGAAGEPAEVVDLSPQGVRFTTAATLAVGQLAALENATFRGVVRVTSVQHDVGRRRCTAGGAFESVSFSEPRGGFVSLRA